MNSLGGTTSEELPISETIVSIVLIFVPVMGRGGAGFLLPLKYMIHGSDLCYGCQASREKHLEGAVRRSRACVPPCTGREGRARGRRRPDCRLFACDGTCRPFSSQRDTRTSWQGWRPRGWRSVSTTRPCPCRRTSVSVCERLPAAPRVTPVSPCVLSRLSLYKTPANNGQPGV